MRFRFAFYVLYIVYIWDCYFYFNFCKEKSYCHEGCIISVYRVSPTCLSFKFFHPQVWLHSVDVQILIIHQDKNVHYILLEESFFLHCSYFIQNDSLRSLVHFRSFPVFASIKLLHQSILVGCSGLSLVLSTLIGWCSLVIASTNYAYFSNNTQLSKFSFFYSSIICAERK